MELVDVIVIVNLYDSCSAYSSISISISISYVYAIMLVYVYVCICTLGIYLSLACTNCVRFMILLYYYMINILIVTSL